MTARDGQKKRLTHLTNLHRSTLNHASHKTSSISIESPILNPSRSSPSSAEESNNTIAPFQWRHFNASRSSSTPAETMLSRHFNAKDMMLDPAVDHVVAIEVRRLYCYNAWRL